MKRIRFHDSKHKMCALTPQIHECFLITDIVVTHISVKLLHTYMYVLSLLDEKTQS